VTQISRVELHKALSLQMPNKPSHLERSTSPVSGISSKGMISSSSVLFGCFGGISVAY